jgi:hypothetical protein
MAWVLVEGLLYSKGSVARKAPWLASWRALPLLLGGGGGGDVVGHGHHHLGRSKRWSNKLKNYGEPHPVLKIYIINNYIIYNIIYII